RAGPCTASDPFSQTLGLEFDPRRLLPRIIHAHLLQPTPISGISPVSDDDAIERAFLATVTGETNYCGHDVFLLLCWDYAIQPIPGGMPFPAKRATCFIIFFVC